MRTKHIESAHVEERTVNGPIYCDGCGADVDDAESSYEDNSVKVEARIGCLYPEGSSRIVYEVDVCAKCFVERIVPALQEAGFKVRTRDEDGDDDGRVWEGSAK